MPEHKCCHCGETKPLTEYHKNRGGFDPRCKACKKAENHQRYLERKPEYHERSTQWRQEHPEEWSRITSAYRKRNLAKDCAKVIARQRLLRAAPGSHTQAEWRSLRSEFGERCACCFRKDGDGRASMLTKDHIVPISCGGSDSISNIQPLCMACNARKGNTVIDYRAATRTKGALK